MKKVLIITYYWPPAGGSGVQRWMYFCKYLPDFEIIPVVVTVDEKKASYKFIDESLNEEVKNVEVHKTNNSDVLRIYSRLVSGDASSAIPLAFAGESNPGLFKKISRYIRGNFFIPDARIGWGKYAYKKAEKIINNNKIDIVITTGPPHSVHLIGLKLKNKYNLKWIADFRDPWADLYYNKMLYRTKRAVNKDIQLERMVLDITDLILTVGPSMKEQIVNRNTIKKDKIKYIYNGYDHKAFKNVKIQKDRNFFTISVIGILSDNHPITSFLKAVKKFYGGKHDICNYLRLRLVGSVSPDIINDINNIVPELKLELLGYVSHSKAISYMLNSDLLLNSLIQKENSQYHISGRLMEYIATGNPILCLGESDSDASKILKNSNFARVFERHDINSIYSFIELIFSNWLKNYNFALSMDDYSQYSRYETTKQLADIINAF